MWQLVGDLRGPLWRSRPDAPLSLRSRWADPDPAGLAPYLGRYRFRRGEAWVRAGERGVVVTTPSRYDGPMVEIPTCRVQRDRFVTLTDGHVIDFVRRRAGPPSGFLHSGYHYARE